jgi:hypothetical protein
MWRHLLQALKTICSTLRCKINDLCFTVREYRPHPVPDFMQPTGIRRLGGASTAITAFTVR